MKLYFICCLICTILFLTVSCGKDSFGNKENTDATNTEVNDFRNAYAGTFFCYEYYAAVQQDTAGEFYWTTDLTDSNMVVTIELESDSDLSVAIGGGIYYAYYLDSNNFSITNGSVNFFHSGDSISIFRGSSPMNHFKYQGNKMP